MSPATNPEAQARENIDRLLIAAGWHVCDISNVNIHAAKDVDIREFQLDAGCGYADYLFLLRWQSRRHPPHNLFTRAST